MTDKKAWTPFMWAVVSENEGLVSKMLKTFDILRHGKNNHNYTALDLAAVTGNVSICGQTRTLDVKISYLGFDKIAEDILDRTVLHVDAYCGFAACV
uniref:ANK_REP_REGION domain-containing protein n=1 Tax=Strongyloides papillosus TaxID=174720 RepID=A0A0N5CAV8_STREA